METVKERLSYFLGEIGVNKSEFGRRIGVSSAFITSMRKSIQPDKIVAIREKFPELNIDWLLTGEGEMLKSTPQPNQSNASIVGDVYSVGAGDEELSMVEFIPVSARASFIENLYVPSDNEFDKIPVPLKPGETEYIEHLRVFEVDGDSMNPTILNGTQILAKEIPPAQWHSAHGVVVVIFSEFVVIKRIGKNRLADENYLVLESDNPKFPSMTVQLCDIRKIYRAVRKISEDIL